MKYLESSVVAYNTYLFIDLQMRCSSSASALTSDIFLSSHRINT